MPKATTNFGEVGVSGLKQQAGVIREEFLRDLQGKKAVKVYTEMASNDPVVGAMMFAVDMIMRQASWQVMPADDTPAAADTALFVDQCRQDMSHTWEDSITEILTMLDFGWSYFEIVFKLRQGPDQKDSKKRSQFDDGRIGWRKFAIRSQESLSKWEIDDTGGIMGMWQRTQEQQDETFIPIEKSLLFRTVVVKNNPEGKSVLRNAYRPWYFKKRIEEIEGIGIERDLAGLPIIKAPPELFAPEPTPDQISALDEAKRIATNIKRDEQEGIVLPALYDNQGNPLWDVKLLTTGGRRQFDTDKIVSRYDQRIAMSLLADFILLGHESVGSFALANSKMDLFAQAINSYLDAIAATINRYALPQLLLLNNIPSEQLPRIVHGGVEQLDLEKLGEYVARLAQSSMPLFPDKDLERYLREQAGMPTTALVAREDDELVVDPDAEDDPDAVDDGQPPEGGGEVDEDGEE